MNPCCTAEVIGGLSEVAKIYQTTKINSGVDTAGLEYANVKLSTKKGDFGSIEQQVRLLGVYIISIRYTY